MILFLCITCAPQHIFFFFILPCLCRLLLIYLWFAWHSVVLAPNYSFPTLFSFLFVCISLSSFIRVPFRIFPHVVYLSFFLSFLSSIASLYWFSFVFVYLCFPYFHFSTSAVLPPSLVAPPPRHPPSKPFPHLPSSPLFPLSFIILFSFVSVVTLNLLSTIFLR